MPCPYAVRADYVNFLDVDKIADIEDFHKELVEFSRINLSRCMAGASGL